MNELRRSLYDVDVRLSDALQHLRDQRACIGAIEAGEHDETRLRLLSCLLREYRGLEIWRKIIVERMGDHAPPAVDWTADGRNHLQAMTRGFPSALQRLGMIERS